MSTIIVVNPLILWECPDFHVTVILGQEVMVHTQLTNSEGVWGIAAIQSTFSSVRTGINTNQLFPLVYYESWDPYLKNGDLIS